MEPTRITCLQCGTVYRVYRSEVDLAKVRVKCKKCGAEVRSDWRCCPNCADKITCTGKYEACVKK